MKTTLIAIAVFIVVVGGAFWYFGGGRNTPAVRQVEERATTQTEDAIDFAGEGVDQAGQKLAVMIEDLKLRADDIREDLAEQGKVVRSKTEDIGETVHDAAIDARAATVIKGKLVADPELSVLRISVAVKDGRATLSGGVASPELIGRVIALALDTEGVHEVTSTIKAD